eukprot:gene12137-8358_t
MVIATAVAAAAVVGYLTAVAEEDVAAVAARMQQRCPSALDSTGKASHHAAEGGEGEEREAETADGEAEEVRGTTTLLSFRRGGIKSSPGIQSIQRSPSTAVLPQQHQQQRSNLIMVIPPLQRPYHPADVFGAVSASPLVSATCSIIAAQLATKSLLRGTVRRLSGAAGQDLKPEPLEVYIDPTVPPRSPPQWVALCVEAHRREVDGGALRSTTTLDKTMHFLVEAFLRDPVRQRQPSQFSASSASNNGCDRPVDYARTLLWERPAEVWGYLWNRFRGVRTSWGPQLPPAGEVLEVGGAEGVAGPPVASAFFSSVPHYVDKMSNAEIAVEQLVYDNRRRIRWLEFTVAALYLGAAGMCRTYDGCQRFLEDKRSFLESIGQCFADLSLWYRQQRRRYRHAELLSVLLLYYGLQQSKKVENRATFCQMNEEQLRSTETVRLPEAPAASLDWEMVFRELGLHPHLARTRPIRAVLRLLHAWSTRNYFDFLALCRGDTLTTPGEHEEAEDDDEHAANQRAHLYAGPAVSLTSLQRAVVFQSFTYARIRALMDLFIPNFYVYSKVRVTDTIPVSTLAYLLLMDETDCLDLLRVLGVEHLLEKRNNVALSCIQLDAMRRSVLSSPAAGSPTPGNENTRDDVLVLRLSTPDGTPAASLEALEQSWTRSGGFSRLFFPPFCDYFGFEPWHPTETTPGTAAAPSPGASHSMEEEDDYYGNDDMEEERDDGFDNDDMEDNFQEGEGEELEATREERQRLLRDPHQPIDWMALLEPYCPPYTPSLASYQLEDVEETWFAHITTHRRAALRRFLAHKRRFAAAEKRGERCNPKQYGAAPLSNQQEGDREMEAAIDALDVDSVGTRSSVFDSEELLDDYEGEEEDTVVREDEGAADDGAEAEETADEEQRRLLRGEGPGATAAAAALAFVAQLKATNPLYRPTSPPPPAVQEVAGGDQPQQPAEKEEEDYSSSPATSVSSVGTTEPSGALPSPSLPGRGRDSNEVGASSGAAAMAQEEEERTTTTTTTTTTSCSVEASAEEEEEDAAASASVSICGEDDEDKDEGPRRQEHPALTPPVRVEEVRESGPPSASPFSLSPVCAAAPSNEPEIPSLPREALDTDLDAASPSSRLALPQPPVLEPRTPDVYSPFPHSAHPVEDVMATVHRSTSRSPSQERSSSCGAKEKKGKLAFYTAAQADGERDSSASFLARPLQRYDAASSPSEENVLDVRRSTSAGASDTEERVVEMLSFQPTLYRAAALRLRRWNTWEKVKAWYHFQEQEQRRAEEKLEEEGERLPGAAGANELAAHQQMEEALRHDAQTALDHYHDALRQQQQTPATETETEAPSRLDDGGVGRDGEWFVRHMIPQQRAFEGPPIAFEEKREDATAATTDMEAEAGIDVPPLWMHWHGCLAAAVCSWIAGAENRSKEGCKGTSLVSLSSPYTSSLLEERNEDEITCEQAHHTNFPWWISCGGHHRSTGETGEKRKRPRSSSSSSEGEVPLHDVLAPPSLKSRRVEPIRVYAAMCDAAVEHVLHTAARHVQMSGAAVQRREDDAGSLDDTGLRTTTASCCPLWSPSVSHPYRGVGRCGSDDAGLETVEAMHRGFVLRPTEPILHRTPSSPLEHRENKNNNNNSSSSSSRSAFQILTNSAAVSALAAAASSLVSDPPSRGLSDRCTAALYEAGMACWRDVVMPSRPTHTFNTRDPRCLAYPDEQASFQLHSHVLLWMNPDGAAIAATPRSRLERCLLQSFSPIGGTASHTEKLRDVEGKENSTYVHANGAVAVACDEQMLLLLAGPAVDAASAPCRHHFEGEAEWKAHTASRLVLRSSVYCVAGVDPAVTHTADGLYPAPTADSTGIAAAGCSSPPAPMDVKGDARRSTEPLHSVVRSPSSWTGIVCVHLSACSYGGDVSSKSGARPASSSSSSSPSLTSLVGNAEDWKHVLALLRSAARAVVRAVGLRRTTPSSMPAEDREALASLLAGLVVLVDSSLLLGPNGSFSLEGSNEAEDARHLPHRIRRGLHLMWTRVVIQEGLQATPRAPGTHTGATPSRRCYLSYTAAASCFDIQNGGRDPHRVVHRTEVDDGTGVEEKQWARVAHRYAPRLCVCCGDWAEGEARNEAQLWESVQAALCLSYLLWDFMSPAQKRRTGEVPNNQSAALTLEYIQAKGPLKHSDLLVGEHVSGTGLLFEQRKKSAWSRWLRGRCAPWAETSRRRTQAGWAVRGAVFIARRGGAD